MTTAVATTFILVHGLLLAPRPPWRSPRTPDTLMVDEQQPLPPALPESEAFARGALGESAWWRQTSTTLQLVVALPEDASFKRDVQLELSRKKISLTVAGAEIVNGDLAHDVRADESDWCVEEDYAGFEAAERHLVIDLCKVDAFVDWPEPLRRDDDANSTPPRMAIGGVGEAQKQATAQFQQQAHAPVMQQNYLIS